MGLIRILLALLVLALGAAAAGAAEPRGRMTGGERYALPGWFKPGFLDIAEDLAEAARRGRHLVLFVHLEECPYCARLLDENFRDGANRAFLEKHFDVVAIDVRGANEVTWPGGEKLTERQLGAKLGVFGTPTLVFLGPGGRVVHRMNGYRHPRPFRQALEFVQGRHYERETFQEYAAREPAPAAWAFRPHPLFTAADDLSGIAGALAVVFESRDCADCGEWHDAVWNHPDVLAQLEGFRVVRLDADSEAPLTDPSGRRTTPRAWAKALGLDYRPGAVLFADGAERARIDGMLYKFHVRELLRYVGEGHYRDGTSVRAYNAARREQLLREGATIDYGR